MNISDGPDREEIAEHFRISAHLSNLLTSLLMPVDRLDFYKKSKAVDSE